MNQEQNSGFLPIGTIVLLKNGTKRLMITGYCAFDMENKNRAFDYCGCLYPEGVISSAQMALFDHNQIEKIFYMGYTDDEDKEFKQRLYESIKDINKIDEQQ